MKHKQNSSDAWKKIGIAAVLIVAAFGFLLFLEGNITGMAPKAATVDKTVDKNVPAGGSSDKAPVFETTKLKDGKVGIVYEETIKVKDKDGDPMSTVSITKGKQAGMTVDETDKATGSVKLKWDKPTKSGKQSVITFQACSTNKYGVKQCTTKDYIIYVGSADTAPSFVTKSLPNAIDGVSYKEEIKVTDIEGDKILLSFEEKSNQYVTLTQEQGKWYLGWTTPNPAGQHNFLIKACSTGKATATELCNSKSFSLIVEADKGPQFITESLDGGVSGQPWESIVQVKELEGDKVTLTSGNAKFKVAPSGEILGAVGKIYNFKLSNPEYHFATPLTLTACSTGKSQQKKCTTKSYTLKGDIDYAPKIVFNLNGGKGDVVASDPDGDAVTFKLVAFNSLTANLKSGAGLNQQVASAAKGGAKIVLSGNPAAGAYSLNVMACSTGASGEEQCTTAETGFTI